MPATAKPPINFLFLVTPPRHLVFTDKGGVGKTSVAGTSPVKRAGPGRGLQVSEASC